MLCGLSIPDFVQKPHLAPSTAGSIPYARGVLPGDVLVDRFVLEDAIDGGGVGQVFRGWDLKTDQAVAIKILRDLSPTDVKRFEREAAILASSRLPGVVRYVDYGTTTNGIPYLVMEWLEGETLAKAMETRGFDLAEAVALLATVCRPIGELHARGVVHRDLKPENFVMTGPQATDIVVIDLGLARPSGDAVTALTATGCVIGTPGYMSPEQVRADVVDARADVFSLGCVLYECITGHAAFAGDNYFALRTKVLLAKPRSIRSSCAEAPRELEDLVDRMIAKTANDRPESARAVAQQLAALGPMPVSPRRQWSYERPAAVMPVAVGEWTGLVLAQGGTGGDSTERRAAVAAKIFGLGDAVRAAAPDGRVEIVDGGYLLVILPPSSELLPLARRLTKIALALQPLVGQGCLTVTVGNNPIEDLIDRSTRLLDQVTRAALFDDPKGERATIHVDAATANALPGELELERRRGVTRLIAMR